MIVRGREENRTEFMGKPMDYYRDIDREILGTSHEQQPGIWLQADGEGDAGARAAGSEPVPWVIEASLSGREVTAKVYVGTGLIADITIRCDPADSPWDEAQLVCAALVWSRIRGILRDNAREKYRNLAE